MGLSSILYDYSGALLAGLWVTLQLCVISWISSFCIGVTLGVAASQAKWVSALVQGISAILAGIPIIVFLFWMYYPAQDFLGILVDPFATACVALSVLGSVMVADAVRQTLANFPHQYVIAAQVSGLSYKDTLLKIVLPINTRAFIPHALFIIITIFHWSLFSSLISVEEIFRVAQRINSVVYQPIEIYTSLAIFCILVSLPLHLTALALRARLSRDTSER